MAFPMPQLVKKSLKKHAAHGEPTQEQTSWKELQHPRWTSLLLKDYTLWEGLSLEQQESVGGGRSSREEQLCTDCTPSILHPPIPLGVGGSRRVRRFWKKGLKLNLRGRPVVEGKVFWFCLSFSLPYFFLLSFFNG